MTRLAGPYKTTREAHDASLGFSIVYRYADECPECHARSRDHFDSCSQVWR